MQPFLGRTSIRMQQKCVNSADKFCYICGDVTISSQKRAITPIIRKAYHLYFGCQIGDQDKSWAPHISCNTCVANLRKWLSRQRRSMPFAVPMVRREQTNHISELLLHGASPPAKFFEEEKVDLKLSEYTIYYAASTSR
jgi:hypothetical protein